MIYNNPFADSEFNAFARRKQQEEYAEKTNGRDYYQDLGDLAYNPGMIESAAHRFASGLEGAASGWAGTAGEILNSDWLRNQSKWLANDNANSSFKYVADPKYEGMGVLDLIKNGYLTSSRGAIGDFAESVGYNLPEVLSLAASFTPPGAALKAVGAVPKAIGVGVKAADVARGVQAGKSIAELSPEITELAKAYKAMPTTTGMLGSVMRGAESAAINHPAAVKYVGKAANGLPGTLAVGTVGGLSEGASQAGSQDFIEGLRERGEQLGLEGEDLNNFVRNSVIDTFGTEALHNGVIDAGQTYLLKNPLGKFAGKDASFKRKAAANALGALGGMTAEGIQEVDQGAIENTAQGKYAANWWDPGTYQDQSNEEFGKAFLSSFPMFGGFAAVNTAKDALHAFNTSTKDMADAVKEQESSGNYEASNPSGAFGAYQFMPSSWNEWAKEAQDAGVVDNTDADNHDTQDKVAQFKIDQLNKKYNGDQKAIAVAWYRGEGNADRYYAGEATDIDGNAWDAPFGNGPSAEEYANSVVSRLNGNSGNGPSGEGIQPHNLAVQSGIDVNSLKEGWAEQLPIVGGILKAAGLGDSQISSTARTPEHNAEVGGAENSYHVRGDAVDIVLPDDTSTEQAEAIRKKFEDTGAFSEVLFHDAGSGYHLHLGGLKGSLADTTATTPQAAPEAASEESGNAIEAADKTNLGERKENGLEGEPLVPPKENIDNKAQKPMKESFGGPYAQERAEEAEEAEEAEKAIPEPAIPIPPQLIRALQPHVSPISNIKVDDNRVHYATTGSKKSHDNLLSVAKTVAPEATSSVAVVFDNNDSKKEHSYLEFRTPLQAQMFAKGIMDAKAQSVVKNEPEQPEQPVREEDLPSFVRKDTSAPAQSLEQTPTQTEQTSPAPNVANNNNKFVDAKTIDALKQNGMHTAYSDKLKPTVFINENAENPSASHKLKALAESLGGKMSGTKLWNGANSRAFQFPSAEAANAFEEAVNKVVHGTPTNAEMGASFKQTMSKAVTKFFGKCIKKFREQAEKAQSKSVLDKFYNQAVNAAYLISSQNNRAKAFIRQAENALKSIYDERIAKGFSTTEAPEATKPVPTETKEAIPPSQTNALFEEDKNAKSPVDVLGPIVKRYKNILKKLKTRADVLRIRQYMIEDIQKVSEGLPSIAIQKAINAIDRYANGKLTALKEPVMNNEEMDIVEAQEPVKMPTNEKPQNAPQSTQSEKANTYANKEEKSDMGKINDAIKAEANQKVKEGLSKIGEALDGYGLGNIDAKNAQKQVRELREALEDYLLGQADKYFDNGGFFDDKLKELDNYRKDAIAKLENADIRTSDQKDADKAAENITVEAIDKAAQEYKDGNADLNGLKEMVNLAMYKYNNSLHVYRINPSVQEYADKVIADTKDGKVVNNTPKKAQNAQETAETEELKPAVKKPKEKEKPLFSTEKARQNWLSMGVDKFAEKCKVLKKAIADNLNVLTPAAKTELAKLDAYIENLKEIGVTPDIVNECIRARNDAVTNNNGTETNLNYVRDDGGNVIRSPFKETITEFVSRVFVTGKTKDGKFYAKLTKAGKLAGENIQVGYGEQPQINEIAKKHNGVVKNGRLEFDNARDRNAFTHEIANDYRTLTEQKLIDLDSKATPDRQETVDKVANIIRKIGIDVCTDPLIVERENGYPLSSSNGTVYGFVKNGRIYLNPNAISVEAPIHEFVHVWTNFIAKADPELWKKGKALLKQTQMWRDIEKNPAYDNIWGNEDLIASEVCAQIAGKRGAERIDEIVKNKTIAERLKNWVKLFWGKLKAMFGFGRKEAKKEGIKELTLNEFLDMPLKQLQSRAKMTALDPSNEVQRMFTKKDGIYNYGVGYDKPDFNVDHAILTEFLGSPKDPAHPEKGNKYGYIMGNPGDMAPGYKPKRCIPCYKLVWLHGDGTFHPLYAGISKPLGSIGEMFYAQGIDVASEKNGTGKATAPRYQIHFGLDAPTAPHLMSCADVEHSLDYHYNVNNGGHTEIINGRAPRPVFIKCYVDASNDYTQQTHDFSKAARKRRIAEVKSGVPHAKEAQDDHAILGLGAFGGYYTFFENNGSIWICSSGAMFADVLYDEDQRKAALKEAGFDEDKAFAEWKLPEEQKKNITGYLNKLASPNTKWGSGKINSRARAVEFVRNVQDRYKDTINLCKRNDWKAPFDFFELKNDILKMKADEIADKYHLTKTFMKTFDNAKGVVKAGDYITTKAEWEFLKKIEERQRKFAQEQRKDEAKKALKNKFGYSDSEISKDYDNLFAEHDLSPWWQDTLDTNKRIRKRIVDYTPELERGLMEIRDRHEAMFAQPEEQPVQRMVSKTESALTPEAQKQVEVIRNKYNGTTKWLKAPNGKPTNLNEIQWCLVRTPAFKKWFGDWENDPKNASMLVDENGEPKIYYRGINRSYNANAQPNPTWISESRKQADGSYTYSPYEEDEPVVLSVFANVKNPVNIGESDEYITFKDFAGKYIRPAINKAFKKGKISQSKSDNLNSYLDELIDDDLSKFELEKYVWYNDDYHDELADILEQCGYDAYYTTELYYEDRFDTYGVLGRSNVKSAIDNNGNYSSSEKHIQRMVAPVKTLADNPELLAKEADNLYTEAIRNFPNIAKDKEVAKLVKEGIRESVAYSYSGNLSADDTRRNGSGVIFNAEGNPTQRMVSNSQSDSSRRAGSAAATQGRATKNSVARDNSKRGSIIGLGVTRALVNNGSISLVGQKINSIHDLAEAAQILRNPGFETFSYLYVNDDGNIVGHEAVSSRLPTCSQVLTKENNASWGTFALNIAKKAKAYGATKLYVAHNHPSGNPTPSRPDLGLTKAMAKVLSSTKVKFAGHLIVDHTTYAAFDHTANSISDVGIHSLPFDAWHGKPSYDKPEKDHAVLGQEINSQHKLDLLANFVKQDGTAENVAFIVTQQNIVRGVVRLHKDFDKMKPDRQLRYLRYVTRATYGAHVFLVTPNRNTYNSLAPYVEGEKEDGITDMVFVKDGNIEHAFQGVAKKDWPNWFNTDVENAPGIRVLDNSSPYDGVQYQNNDIQRMVIPEDDKPIAYEDLPAEERKIVDEYLDSRSDGDIIRERLARHAGTPWNKQVVNAIKIRVGVENILEGKDPEIFSKLFKGGNQGIRKAAAKGWEGLWKYITYKASPGRRSDRQGFIGHPEKPGNAVNSSLLNCNPSDDCANYCYTFAPGSNYNWPTPAAKAELVTMLVEKDPIRAANMTAKEYKLLTGEKNPELPLRLFDKGDMSEAWIPFIKQLNNNGIKTQVFSKRPELLRRVDPNPEKNLVLLSVDASNYQIAFDNPDLPIAIVYSGTQKDKDFIGKMEDRFKKHGGSILPIVQGKRYLSNAELAEMPKWTKPYLCPRTSHKEDIEKGNEIGEIFANWHCYMCYKDGGVGCCHGRTPEAIKKLRETAAEVENLDEEPIRVRIETIERILQRVRSLEGVPKAERESILNELVELDADLRADLANEEKRRASEGTSSRNREREETVIQRLSVPESQIEAVRKKYEGTKEWMKAPNGKPTNLNERQWLHVRTPNFINWFGDWRPFAYAKAGKLQGTSYTVSEAEDELKEILTDKFKELSNNYGTEISLKGLRIHGSRARNTAREDSDIDVVVEYDGNISEDSLFNDLNDGSISIDGVNVDVNPITKNEGHTLESYLKQDKNYDSEKMPDCSKVVDENGEPRVVYHGTNWKPSEKNGTFDTKKVGRNFPDMDYDYNFYFTASKSGASEYGGNVLSVFLNIRNPEMYESDPMFSDTDEEAMLGTLIAAHDEGDRDTVPKVNDVPHEDSDGAIYSGAVYNEEKHNAVRKKHSDKEEAYRPQRLANVKKRIAADDELHKAFDAVFEAAKNAKIARFKDILKGNPNAQDVSDKFIVELAEGEVKNALPVNGYTLEEGAEAIAKDEDIDKSLMDKLHEAGKKFSEAREAVSKGYDDNVGAMDLSSVPVERYSNADLYLCDDPNQIKSATDNDGTYSTSDDHIQRMVGTSGETNNKFDAKARALSEKARNGAGLLGDKVRAAAQVVNDKGLKMVGWDASPVETKTVEGVEINERRDDDHKNEMGLISRIFASPQHIAARLSDDHPFVKIVNMGNNAMNLQVRLRTHLLNLLNMAMKPGKNKLSDEETKQLFSFLVTADEKKIGDKKAADEAMDKLGFSKNTKKAFHLIRKVLDYVYRLLNEAALKEHRFTLRNCDTEIYRDLLRLNEGRMFAGEPSGLEKDNKGRAINRPITITSFPKFTYFAKRGDEAGSKITKHIRTLEELDRAQAECIEDGGWETHKIEGEAAWNSTTKFSAINRDLWMRTETIYGDKDYQKWLQKKRDFYSRKDAPEGSFMVLRDDVRDNEINPDRRVHVVTYSEKLQPVGFSTSYLPHMWRQYKVFAYRPGVGNASVTRVCIGSAATLDEAVAFGNKHRHDKIPTDPSHEYTGIIIERQLFNFEQLGVDADQIAGQLGLSEWNNAISKIQEAGAMELSEASRLLKSADITKTSYDRFFGHLLERKGAQGYEKDDIEWVLSSYLAMAARFVALESAFKPGAVDLFENAYGNINEEHHGDAGYAKDYIFDINGNPSGIEEAINYIISNSKFWKKYIIPHYGDRAAITLANSLSTKMTHLCLGFCRLSTCLLNLSQIVNCVPYIGDIGAYHKILARTAKTLSGNFKGRNEPGALAGQAFKGWERAVLRDTGVLNDITMDSASGFDKNRSGFFLHPSNKFERAFNKVSDLGMKPFTLTDQAIRVGTVIAAYEKKMKDLKQPVAMKSTMTAQQKTDWKKAHAAAIKFAKEVNDKGNFNYSQADSPNVFRRGSIVAQLALQFKKYPIKELEVIADMLPIFSTNQNITATQKVMFWLPFMLMCGAMGVPALDWLDEIMYGITGKHPKTSMKKTVMESKLPDWAKRTMLYGVLAAPPFGADISSRAGLADVVPTSMSSDKLLGPAYSKSKKTAEAFTKWWFHDGKAYDILKNVLPSTVNDVISTGIGSSEDARGRLNYKYSAAELPLKLIGARPAGESVSADKALIQKEERLNRRQEEKDAIDAYIKEPSAKNAKLIGELGITQKRIADERKQKAMTRTERTKAGLSKQETKDFEFMDFMNEDD